MAWNKAIETGITYYTYLIEKCFCPSLSDACVYTKYKDIYTIIIARVDDILIATKCNNEHMINTKNILKQKF